MVLLVFLIMLSSDSQNTDHLFSPQDEGRFQKRYEEVYDLFDPKYTSWIEINHPENSYRSFHS